MIAMLPMLANGTESWLGAIGVAPGPVLLAELAALIGDDVLRGDDTAPAPRIVEQSNDLHRGWLLAKSYHPTAERE
jgi:hypothetical protein